MKFSILLCVFAIVGVCLFSTVPQTVYASGGIVPLVNPIGGTANSPEGRTDVKSIVGDVLKVLLGVLGSLTLVVFVVGSFQWLTSAGKSDKIQQGMRTMLFAAIGLFIIFGAYAILSTVINTLTT